MSCKINGFKNGPLEVDCEKVVCTKEGKVFETDNPSHPCRCGHSKNKPFCDGAHVKAGFSSRREIKEEKLQVYDGKEISIHFNRSICSGAAKCVQGLSSVFHSGSSLDWIFPDDDTNEKIISQISACPSGALSYAINNKTELLRH
ncbi:(4Fe-4S)-binding protein [Sulfurimonas sp. MAG313]|nr:(4Fe-4S)-binding protein [Sulfurimonas sp. MAG313]MDF1880909.1 (4Fe-4S)-binding protein [Sulfurimonas sp. MAG313]